MDADEIAIEREKLAIEREKLTIDRDKASTEIRKATVEENKLKEEYKRTRYTAVSVLFAGAAIIGSAWSQSYIAKKGFDIKVAEIVMNASEPEAAQNKCAVLKGLYPRELDKLVCDIRVAGTSSPLPDGDTDVETKKEFFKLLAAKESDPHKLVKAWKTIFPKDKWIDALDSATPYH